MHVVDDSKDILSHPSFHDPTNHLIITHIVIPYHILRLCPN